MLPLVKLSLLLSLLYAAAEEVMVMALNARDGEQL